jgi:probable phosphoglycerate mutase
MTRFIVTRHGQSIANAECRFAGHSDFDLSEIGKQQAELVADYLCKNFKIDAIYSSDLLRAFNTALPTASRLGLEIIPMTSLREINAGEWEGRTTDEIQLVYPEDFGVWKNDYANSRCTGGESTAEVYDRVYETICKIAEDNGGKTVYVSTHATLLRSLCLRSQGFAASEANEIPFSHNAAICVFDFEDGKLTPVELNITEHLGDVITAVHSSFTK